MLDIKFIRENVAEIKKAAKDKNIEIDLDKLLSLDEKRRELIQKVETIKAAKNEASKAIAKLKGDDKEKAIKEMQKQGDDEKELSDELSKVTEEYDTLMLWVPSPPLPQVPVGEDDSGNVEERTWGELPKFDFEPKDHVALGEHLDIIDIPRGVKLSGSRFYILKGAAVRLEQALLNFALDQLTAKGFTSMSVPVLVQDAAMYGTSYFPGGEEQAYRIEKDELLLV